MIRFAWTKEREAKVAEMWNAGYSTSEIVDYFGGKTVVTRNSVIGKINRMGLARFKKPPAGMKPVSMKPYRYGPYRRKFETQE